MGLRLLKTLWLLEIGVAFLNGHRVQRLLGWASADLVFVTLLVALAVLRRTLVDLPDSVVRIREVDQGVAFSAGDIDVFLGQFHTLVDSHDVPIKFVSLHIGKETHIRYDTFSQRLEGIGSHTNVVAGCWHVFVVLSQLFHGLAVAIQIALKNLRFFLIELLSIPVGFCDLPYGDLLVVFIAIELTQQKIGFALVIKQALDFGLMKLSGFFFEVLEIPENILKLRSLVTVTMDIVYLLLQKTFLVRVDG